MYFRDAWEIIRKHHAIPRKASKKILGAIVRGGSVDVNILQQHSSLEEFNALRQAYDQKKMELEQSGVEICPRNLPFYHLICERIPDFKWDLVDAPVTRGTIEVHFSRPNLEGLIPSLMTMLLRKLPEGTSSSLHETYRCAHQAPREIVNSLSRLFDKHRFYSPTEVEMAAILNWLKRGLNGEELTILTPLCPDYRADEVGTNLYRFTFDGIGNQVGVVGKRWLSVLPDVMKTLDELNIRANIIAAIGDFEGFPEGALKRLGVTWDEFELALRGSQSSLKQCCEFDIRAPLFTELCGGRHQWEKLYAPIREQLLRGDYGNTKLTDAELAQIAQARKPLYRRWLQKRGDFDFMETLLSQGAEYATMGLIAKEKLSSVLILGADHGRMAPFYHIASDVPVLYMRNNYVNVN